MTLLSEAEVAEIRELWCLALAEELVDAVKRAHPEADRDRTIELCGRLVVSAL